MTNEEAIHAIKSNYPPERYTMLREALDMAMELLAADPTPVQPDTPKVGDKVRTNTAWKHLEGVVTGVSKYHAMVDFGFPVEFEIPLEQLEVIKDEN